MTDQCTQNCGTLGTTPIEFCTYATTHIRSGRFEAAIAHLEKARRILDDRTPGLSESSHASLVYAYAALGRYETAERLLAWRGAEWAWLLTGLASLYEDLGRLDCALALGEKALKLGRAGAVLNPSEPMTEAPMHHERPVWVQKFRTRQRRIPSLNSVGPNGR